MPLPLTSVCSEAPNSSAAAGSLIRPATAGGEARGSAEAAAAGASADCSVVERTIGAKAVGCGRLKVENDGSDLEI